MARPRQELVGGLTDTCRFANDRVQEAAFSLIAEALRAEAQLRIGRLLAGHIPPERRKEAIFDIVNQLNPRGPDQLTRAPRAAGRIQSGRGQARQSLYGHASALKHLVAGAPLLPGDTWEHRRELIDLESHRAKSESHRSTGGIRAAPGDTVDRRRHHGRTSQSRLPASGSIHGARPGQSRDRRRF
jgi:predicted ATPase